MSTLNLNDCDRRLRAAVIDQLEWDPAVDASAIGVAARDGAVTLTGFVDTYAEKLAAERAALHPRGVRSIANDLEVRLKTAHTDADIAANAAAALRRLGVPGSIQATVRRGHLTLTGTSPCPIHRFDASHAMRQIAGVRYVTDRIAIVPDGFDCRTATATAGLEDRRLDEMC